jgi:hypothetical protein
VASGFIEHRGKRIYVIDAVGIDGARVDPLAAQAAAAIRAEPKGSVLTITNVKDSRVDQRFVQALRQLAEGNAPYVKAACVTGVGPVHKIVFYTVKILARRDFKLFDTLEEAKDYLAGLP